FAHFLSLWHSWLRPPPRSALFPYTTLFRSVVVVLAAGDLTAAQAAAAGALDALGAGAHGAAHGVLHGPAVADALLQLLGDVLRQDRKSTRLNSSHVSISYAVFCLKKTT